MPASSASSHDPIPRENEVELFQGTDICEARFFAFDTEVSLQLYGPLSAGGAQQLLQQAVADCRCWGRLFSRTLPHSDISRLNGAAGRKVAIAEDTFQLLQEALRYCAASEGVFDVTVGNAMGLWNFKKGISPTAEQRQEACRHIDWRNLLLCRSADGTPCAQLADPAAAVYVGGIAKGWMADELLQAWNPNVSSGMLANLGSNVAVRGSKPSGEPWRVGIRNPQDPRNSQALLGAVPIDEGSVVTSGTYERSFAAPDGKVLHHILDPRTALPVETDVAAVTVVARRSLDAEGYSTTLLALGLKRGIQLVRETPQLLQAFFVTPEGFIVAARQ